MVMKTVDGEGHEIRIYDQFAAGIMVPEEGENKDFINIAFTEGDRHISHVFKIHEEQIEPFLNMVRDAAGAKLKAFSMTDLKKMGL